MVADKGECPAVVDLYYLPALFDGLRLHFSYHYFGTFNMTTSSVQDRTGEFRSVLTQLQKRQGMSRVGAQRQSLLSDTQRDEANDSPAANGKKRSGRSEFARRAAEIGRGITGTMAKLERLAQRRSFQCSRWSWS